MKFPDLNQLDFSDVGGWPLPTKVAAIVIVCAISLGAGFWFDTQEQLKILDQSREREKELKSTFEIKQSKAANIDAYRKQMVDMKKSLGTMLQQLPGKTEVEGVIDDVSQMGLTSGLEFDLFKPEKETPIEFYAELPIKIKVVGGYNEIGAFVSGVAALPRIVTLHDISIIPMEAKKDKKKGSLVMEATAKTYRYLEEDTE